MKEKIIIVIAVLLVVSLVGGGFVVSVPKCVNTEYKTVEVSIVDEHYSPLWMQPMKYNNITTYITHPAEYKIMVIYNDIKFTINDYDIYYKYKNKIGEVINGTLEIKTYDNNTVKYDIIALK